MSEETMKLNEERADFGATEDKKVIIFTIPLLAWSQMNPQDGAAMVKGWFDTAKSYALNELLTIHRENAKKTSILTPATGPVKLTVQ